MEFAVSSASCVLSYLRVVLQIGVASGLPDSRQRVRTFTFDHVFWSVDAHDKRHATQEMVSSELLA